MLNEFIREQDEKPARLKQQRVDSEKAKTTKTASIQCDRRDVLEKSDVAVQTEFSDVMDDLKEQIRQLSKIVADLTALKNSHGEVPNTRLLYYHRRVLSIVAQDFSTSELQKYFPCSKSTITAARVHVILFGKGGAPRDRYTFKLG